jgi:hypothetical protein
MFKYWHDPVADELSLKAGCGSLPIESDEGVPDGYASREDVRV